MKYNCVQAKIEAAEVKYPEIAAILADPVHGGWEGNEMVIDAIIGTDAELRQVIWQYSLACQYEGDAKYFRKNDRTWYNLLCIEQNKRVYGGKCDALTEYRCEIWKASFAKNGGMVRFSCTGCEKGKAHESSMQERAGYTCPVYAPIDGGTGA